MVLFDYYCARRFNEYEYQCMKANERLVALFFINPGLVFLYFRGAACRFRLVTEFP